MNDFDKLVEKGEAQRSYISHVKEAKPEGAVPFRLTELKIDRIGEVVKPDGAILKDYKDNPIVLFRHGFGHDSVPIGKIDTDSINMTKDYLDADVVFDEDGSDPFAKMIASKVRNGFLNAGSIGFRPIVTSKEPLLPKQTGVSHLKYELMEYSIVPIPMLTSSLAKREWHEFEEECKESGHEFDPEFMKQFEDTHEDFTDEALKKTKSIMDEYDEDVFKEIKEGRVLSGKNRRLVKSAVEALEPAVDVLRSLLEATEPKPKETELESQIIALGQDLQQVRN